MAGIAVKAIGWSFFIGALGFATASLTANLSLVTKVYYPREALPISTVLTQSTRSHSRGNAPCIRAWSQPPDPSNECGRRAHMESVLPSVVDHVRRMRATAASVRSRNTYAPAI